MWEPTIIITLPHLHRQSLSHDTTARPSHGVGTEADEKNEGDSVPRSNVHRHRQRQRQWQQQGNQSTGGGHPSALHTSPRAPVTSRPPLQLG